MNAYNEGYSLGSSGGSPSQNPYNYDTEEYREWKSGFDSGMSLWLSLLVM